MVKSWINFTTLKYSITPFLRYSLIKTERLFAILYIPFMAYNYYIQRLETYGNS